MDGLTKVYAVATTEPVTLAELKFQLGLDSGSFEDNIGTLQSIIPGAYSVTVGYSLVGSYAAVLKYSTLVSLNAGTIAGVLDAKIQESDTPTDPTSWTDWVGGAFAQVVAATGSTVQSIEYTGSKGYIRVVAQISTSTCSFSADIIRNDPISLMDGMLAGYIAAARQYVEIFTRRVLVTKTYDYFLSDWPESARIQLPYTQLQTVTSVSYKDYEGNVIPLTAVTDYIVETNGDFFGYLVLPYNKAWPSVSLYPSNPITIRFVCGVAQADIDPLIKQAILMICTDLYENRGETDHSGKVAYENPRVTQFLWPMRVWD